LSRERPVLRITCVSPRSINTMMPPINGTSRPLIFDGAGAGYHVQPLIGTAMPVLAVAFHAPAP
jgi:hypothetical protein